MSRASVFALLVFFALSCRSVDTPVAEKPDQAHAAQGMVVSAHIDASRAGLEILKRGGNAVDAAVATGFALAVVHPSAGNIGGGGFMIIRHADGEATSFDYREKAPMAAWRDMFLDDEGEFDSSRSQRGYLASGVPGSVAGMVKAHEQYGRLSLREVMAPAIHLAGQGFILSHRMARSFNGRYDSFSEFPGTARYFTKGSRENSYEGGERFVQEDLARTLRRISRHGRDGFYRGETADLIVREMERGGGLITHADLEAYEAVEREPLVGTYRGHRILSMGPPSSGGVALIQLLNAVEPHDIRSLGFNSSATVHLMGEAMRRVYADRAEWLGDPDFADVPAAALIEKSYMQQRMAGFDPDRADSSAAVTHGDPMAFESMETTHYSVVDRDGNAVSVTTTINGSYGSDVVVDGAGFFLNNEMDDFSAKPGVPNMFGLVGSDANAVEPGKRMLSSMTPTIVEDTEGRLFMIIGSPGGSRIITTVFQVILNVIDHRAGIQSAVTAPRVHHQWLPDRMEFERLGLARDVVENLESRGWSVREGSNWGRADGITVGYGRAGRLYYGGADPRGEDAVAGY